MAKGPRSSQRRPAAAASLPGRGGGPTVQPGTFFKARAVTAFEVSEMMDLCKQIVNGATFQEGHFDALSAPVASWHREASTSISW